MRRKVLTLLLIALVPWGAVVAEPASAKKIAFDVPAQPLTNALVMFAGQAAIESLLYNPQDLQAVDSVALIGNYTLKAALELLLQNSSLVYRQLDSGVIVINRALKKSAKSPRFKRARRQLRKPETELDHDKPLLEEVVTIGTRVKGRTVTETAVPVDILSGDMVQLIGATELGERLQTLAPSFNFSRTTVSDGTDFVRPATLRGLSPDQMLVLINGKRRHNQAQINIQQVVGRGSSGTDINAIPLSAVERVEVLRDGAAAQYGSDAIAGVINIVLKSQTEQTDVLAKYGQTQEGDGETTDLSVNTGWDLNGLGYLNISLESLDRGESNRAGLDSRFEPPRVSMKIGEAENDYYALFLNGGIRVGEGEAYLFGGISRREGESAGFYRGAGADPAQVPVSSRYVPALYPEGFLPLQKVEVDDDYLTLGYTSPLSGQWELDTSMTYGRNRFSQGTEQSVNVSLGVDSPTEADNGHLEYQQLTANLDFVGRLDLGWPDTLYLAAGLEYRDERYRIRQGDFASYAYGIDDDFSIFIPSPIDPCPNEPGPLDCADGRARDQAQAGMQAFPGFRSDVNESRDSVALYVDAETNVTPQWLLGAAVRFEHYGDVGSNTTGKLSFRYQWLSDLAFRGALSSGFRAPGLNQRAFTNVLTNIGPDLLTETLHAAEGSAAVQALGVDALEEERSTQWSLGLVWMPRSNVTLTLDWYRIEIKDRIVMTDVIPEESVGCVTPTNCPLAEVLDALNQNIGAVQFFTNAIDTKTQGVDLVLSGDWTLDSGALLQLSGMVHVNKTRVERIHTPQSIAPEVLFSQAQINLTETGQPRQRVTLGLDWSHGPWRAHLHLNRYGKVKTSYFTEDSLGVDVPGAEDDVHGSNAAWLTDVDLSYRFGNGLQLALGANNLFDMLPDKLDSTSVPSFFTGGSFVYPWESTPYGIKGAYYYARVQYTF